MQFGQALQRILHSVRHANTYYGPVYLSKHDIKDGILSRSSCGRPTALACPSCSPAVKTRKKLITMPMSLMMGWVESPPSFYAMSKTVANLANQCFQGMPTHCLPHQLSPQAEALDCLNPPEGGEKLTALDDQAEGQLAEIARDKLEEPCCAPSRPQQLAA